MKKIEISNDALLELLNEHFEIICDEKMRMVINDEDADRIHAFVKENAAAAQWDYCIESIDD